jgi:hypothetical protein
MKIMDVFDAAPPGVWLHPRKIARAMGSTPGTVQLLCADLLARGIIEAAEAMIEHQRGPCMRLYRLKEATK